MRRALRELVIVGLPTSQVFHLRVLEDPAFQRGEVDIGYLERHGDQLLAEPLPGALAQPIAILAALLADERRGGVTVRPRDPAPGKAGAGSPWLRAAREEGLRS
jgi:acetyl/propionyl-CoA carboxylase alpha subunit